MMGHLMLYGGLAVLAAAALAAVLAALWFYGAGKRLDKTLEKEYGRKRC